MKRTPGSVDGAAGATEGAEVKQAVLTSAVLKGGQRLRVAGFRGSYKDTRFDDGGVSRGPVSQATREALLRDFPEAQIEEVEE